MSKSRAPRVEENGIVKVERVDENSRPVSPNQLKRKRDELEVEGEGEGLAAVRKSEDGSVKIALTQNGIMKVKMSSASSSSPPFTQAVPKPKSNRRRGTNASELVEDPSALRNETPEPEKKDEAPVNGDYSKAKAPPQQIPVAQFWSFCESQYFRPLTDEDFAFLDSNGDDVTPFIAPPLGRHYLEQWADEDGALFERPPLLLHSEPNRRHASTSTAYPAATLFASRPEYDDSHSTFISLTGGGRAGCREGGGSSLGDLGQRIIDLVREQDITVPGLDLDSCQKQWNEAAPEEEEALEEENDIAAFRHGTSSDYYGHDGYENGSRTARASMPNGKSGEFVHLEPTPAAAAGRPYTEFLPLEDRLLNELKHIGVIDGTKIAMDHKDNDEISQELRRVQHDLLQQMLDNQAKKQRLKELAAYHRGYEQYCSVLDALSKQIEAGYAKRAKTQPKPKKKGGKGGGGGGTAASAGPSLTNSVMAVTTSASTTFTANIAAAPTTITATANSISSSSPSSSSASPFHIINGNSIISNGNTSNTSSSTTSATAASSLSTISSNNAPVSLSLSPTTAPLRQPHSSSSSSLSTLSLASATSLPFASAATSASASSSSTSSTSSTPAPAPAPAPAAATVAGAAAATNTAARSPGVSQQILELIERRAFVIESVGCLFPPEKVSIPTESVFATRVEG
ncbi:histone acetyltransferases subunit 3-domain-containing protein [Zopfochytrium polystomum]|nr:histone acetyltransferases subunit 3-domain-containing protein [Zopfochytrium polystomum]